MRKTLTEEERKIKNREYNRKWKENNREKAREYNRKWALNNVEKNREISRKWAEKNKERVKEKNSLYKKSERYREYARLYAKKNRFRKYKITESTYSEMLVNQKNRCAICNELSSNKKRGLYVDHDHKTGKIRGLLCGKCNSGIGMLKDDISILKKAIVYLNNQ